MNKHNSPYGPAIFVTSMGLYFLGAPIACFVFASWWPLAIGLGGLLGVVCLLIAFHVVRDAREENRKATEAARRYENGLIDMNAVANKVRLEGLNRERSARAGPDDLPSPRPREP